MTDTILFDLDGTLIPYRAAPFVRAYIEDVLRVLRPLGFEQTALSAAIWKSNEAICRNDGRATNREVFYGTMEQALGPRVWEAEPLMHRYYETEFDSLRSFLEAPRDCRPLLDGLRAGGRQAALLTNPFFPLAAVRTRLAWVNLTPEDFLLVTTYDNSRSAKPNPAYFQEALKQIGKTPEQCLMVGNDAREDMAAAQLGIGTFFVTDYPENAEGIDTLPFPQGSYDELVTFLCKEK